jgi:acyl dehydratase
VKHADAKGTVVPDLASVRTGFEFSPQVIRLDGDVISSYVAAVEDPFSGYDGPKAVVPPLAALALSMRGLTDLLLEHPGAIHVTQQLTSIKPIAVGSEVNSTLLVKNRSERRGFAALTLEARLEADGEPVVLGSMLLMVPLSPGGAARG